LFALFFKRAEDQKKVERVSKIARDALNIWQAGVDSVRADRVLRDTVAWDGRWLHIEGAPYDLRGVDRIIVVGAGKASCGMLVGLSDSLRSSGCPLPMVIGWVQIPEGSVDPHSLELVSSASWRVNICEARPRGVNEPTEKVVAGTREIVRLVESAGPKDCVIVLLSGGGSALLCLPIDGIPLNCKIEVTRSLSALGASIEQLNEVRRCLSQVKGGGLARRCHAKLMLTLIISDVLGDPVEYIASGPTILDPPPNPENALRILQAFCPGRDEHRTIKEFLLRASQLVADDVQSRAGAKASAKGLGFSKSLPNLSGSMLQGFWTRQSTILNHHVLANNATAVDAAGTRAVEFGYRYWMHSAKTGDGPADMFGRKLAEQLFMSSRDALVDCLISGGEPTVVLPEASRLGRGGRNQHLVLAAGEWICSRWSKLPPCEFAILSGGTDGEDGNTTAAGAWIDHEWIERCRRENLALADFLDRCDSNSIFKKTGGLLETNATHTNVCDLRVGIYRTR